MSLPPAELAYQEAHITDDRRQDIVIADAVCLSVAILTVVLRFVARAMIKAPVRIDSYMIILATLFTIAWVVSNLLCVHFGLGRHLILCPDVVTFTKMGLLTEAIYTPAIMFTKFSILCLYSRLFPGKVFNRILWTIGIFVGTYSVCRICVDVMQCLPFEADWDPTLPGAKCVNLSAELITFSVMNTVTDVIILILPLPLLWQLKIATIQKLQLMGIFMLGGLVCVMSVVRSVTLDKIDHLDPSYDDVDSCIWSTVETCVAVICANLPCLRPLSNYVIYGKAQLSRSTGYNYNISSKTADSEVGREFRRIRSVTDDTDSKTSDKDDKEDDFNFSMKEIDTTDGTKLRRPSDV